MRLICSGGQSLSETHSPVVFISYQWDMHSRVEDLTRIMQLNGLTCSSDVSPTLAGQPRGSSGFSVRSVTSAEGTLEALTSQNQRNIRAAHVVLCCITAKYLQSDNCSKDLTLAETFRKPIVPVMLRFCPWPPEAAPQQVRKILARLAPVDLSNDKLFKQNLPTLIEKIHKTNGEPARF